MSIGSPKHFPYLIPILILFVLAFLLFAGVILRFFSNLPSNPIITNIPSSVTRTTTITPFPSVTSTITLTPRPTWTLRPSATPSETPTSTFTKTPTLIRTITPASPAKTNNRYELKPWDLAEQLNMVELLKANTILKGSNDSYKALAYAEGEAAIRFPQAVDATEWIWDRAYDLVRINDPQGIALYSDLIKSAIASGQVLSNDLPSWFGLYETRLSVQISPLPPQPGELSRELIEIIGSGSAYLWLIENPNGTNVYPLINDIDFAHPHEDVVLYNDLTGDASPEIVIYRQVTPGVTIMNLPYIFDLSASPPVKLPIQDQAPIDFGLEPRMNAAIITNNQGGNILRITYSISPACPTNVTQDYRWNGYTFITSPLQYKSMPVKDLAAYCESELDEASSSWGPEAAINIATSLLSLWPPALDTQGQPYPPDAYDQLRYRLGVLSALTDQSSEATRIMSEIVNTPIVADSTWVAPAEEFLRVYQTSEDIYTACQNAQYCNLRDALMTLVKNSSTTDPSQTLIYLQNHGVLIHSSGYFDFDKDGKPERWMIIQPNQQSKLEFWILSRTQSGVQAIFVQLFEVGDSMPYYHEPAGSMPVVQFELHKGFIFKHVPETLEAYIQWVDVEYSRPTIILEDYQQALNALMSGADPARILDSLLELFISPRFTGDCIAFNICDQFHYTLGLAYNLLSDDSNAIDQYLWVWRNYGSSPYAIMARLKLNYFPLPTYTRTPIPTSTSVPTRTSTPSLTKSPTATITPTMTVTQTSTNTATSTETVTITITP